VIIASGGNNRPKSRHPYYDVRTSPLVPTIYSYDLYGINSHHISYATGLPWRNDRLLCASAGACAEGIDRKKLMQCQMSLTWLCCCNAASVRWLWVESVWWLQ